MLAAKTPFEKTKKPQRKPKQQKKPPHHFHLKKKKTREKKFAGTSQPPAVYCTFLYDHCSVLMLKADSWY